MSFLFNFTIPSCVLSVAGLGNPLLIVEGLCV